MAEKYADRVVIPLDGMTDEQCYDLIDVLAPIGVVFKLGLQLIVRQSAGRMADAILKRGGQVFLDGKFNDIPATVKLASAEALEMGVNYFNVMAAAGIDSMRAAVDVAGSGSDKVLAVTVLTSLDEEGCQIIFGSSVKATVLRMARDVVMAGAFGLICSAQEAMFLQGHPEVAGLKLFTPGIRPAWAAANDQKRIVTPTDAIKANVYKIIVGRPVTKPPKEIGSPENAVKLILEEVGAAMTEVAQ